MLRQSPVRSSPVRECRPPSRRLFAAPALAKHITIRARVIEMLRARGAEEAHNLTGLLAHAPKRDRYGGIIEENLPGPSVQSDGELLAIGS